MKALIIYDSAYGNTEAIARVIARTAKAELCLVKNVQLADVRTADLIIVGSPTHGGRPTPALEDFLRHLPAGGLAKTAVAAFDTRFALNDHGRGLQLLMHIIGYAAPRIVKRLEAKGADVIALPEGFFVRDKYGPLKPGELERATEWAKAVVHSVPDRALTV